MECGELQGVDSVGENGFGVAYADGVDGVL